MVSAENFVLTKMIVEHFRHGGVLALTTGLTKLPPVDESMLRLVLHGPVSEQRADHQIEIRLKEVDDT